MSCLSLIPFSGFSQLVVNGKIQTSSNWENKLYVIRVDRLGAQVPMLIDSVFLNNDGSFSYRLLEDHQGILYEFRQPPKGGNYRSLTSGFNDNWFHVISNNRAVSVKGHSDSLYYSLMMSGDKMNETLLMFRNFKRPIANCLKQLTDSIKVNPTKTQHYKESGMVRLIAETETLKKRITSVLDTCNSAPLIIAGLYYLDEAYFGQVPKKEIDRYSHKLQNEKLNIVRYIKSDHQDRNRIGSIVTDIQMMNMKGKTVSINDLKSKYKVLDFWASWCGPCRQSNKHSLPQLNTFLSENNIPLIAISIDNDKAKWKGAIKQDKTTWSQWLDTTGMMKKLINVQGVPVYFVLDENNKLIFEAITTFQVETFIKSKLSN